MNSLIILFCVGFSAISLTTFGSAYGAFQPSENYVIEAHGFSISEKTIDSSLLDLSFLTTTSGEKIIIQVIDGSVFFQGKDFVFSKFDVSVLRDGKFLRLVGISEDSQGNELTLRLFGRLVGTSSDATVYEFKGKLDHNNELYSSHFVGKTEPEMKMSEDTFEIQNSDQTPEMTDSEKKIEVPESVKAPIKEIKMLMLGDASHIVPLKDKFQFKIRVYDEEKNPLKDKNKADGFLSDVNVKVQIFDKEGIEFWSSSGQTNERGVYSGFVNAPTNYRLTNQEYAVKYSLEYQGNTLVYDDSFFVFHENAARIMKPIK